jgi:hypothetical protein
MEAGVVHRRLGDAHAPRSKGGGLAQKAIKGTRDRTNKGVGGRPEWSIGGDMFICWGMPCSLRAAG